MGLIKAQLQFRVEVAMSPSLMNIDTVGIAPLNRTASSCVNSHHALENLMNDGIKEEHDLQRRMVTWL